MTITITLEETKSISSNNTSSFYPKPETESSKSRAPNTQQTPIIDVLIFGEKGVGKKSFMQRADEAQQIELKKTISRDEHFKYYDYIKLKASLPKEDIPVIVRLWRQTTECKGFTSPQLRSAVCAIYLVDVTKSPHEASTLLQMHRRVV